MVGFNNFDEMKEFLERAGVIVQTPETDKHYIIVGEYTGKPIGCTSDRLDVLFEEPGATFQEVEYDKCPVHNEE